MENILFILVLYNKLPEESAAYISLTALLGEEAQDSLYIHDNTQHNIMLAKAYNCGLAEARKRGKKWIVLLDDDTHLNETYLQALLEATSNSQCAIAAPILKDQFGTQISPTWYDARRGPFLYNSTKPKNKDVMNILNSGLAIRCDIIAEVNDFNEDFPLDYLDIWLCYTLHQKHIPITIMPATLQHNLSIKDYRNNVSLARYRSILESERRFAYVMGNKAKVYYRLRLLCRAIKWSLTGHLYTRETWKMVFRR